jgi:hypothetical protein
VQPIAAEPVDLGLPLGELRPGLEELPAVPIGQLLRPCQALLGRASGVIGLLGPSLGDGKPRTETVVLLHEASGTAALGPQPAPDSERILEVGGKPLAIGPLAFGLRRPLAGSANPARAGA